MDEVPESTEDAYQQAFSRMLNQQRERAHENRQAELNVLALLKDKERKEESEKKQRSAMRQRYQQELQEQIKLDQQRKELSQVEKRIPGIAVDFHGFPNLPQTPKEVRRKREVDKQVEFSKSVAEQQAEHARQKREAIEQELRLAKNMIELDNREKEREMMSEVMRKRREKDVLRKAWVQADRAKRMIKDIEKAVLLGNPGEKPDFVRETSVVERAVTPISAHPKPLEIDPDPVPMKPNNSPDPPQEPIPDSIPRQDSLPASTPKTPNKSETLTKALEEHLTPSQIHSLVQILAASVPKLPLIRQYSANDMPIRSPVRKDRNVFKVRFSQNRSVEQAPRYRKSVDRTIIQDRVARLQARVRDSPWRSPMRNHALRINSIPSHSRSPIKAVGEIGKGGKTYITEGVYD